jgi:hypothetical protein
MSRLAPLRDGHKAEASPRDKDCPAPVDTACWPVRAFLCPLVILSCHPCYPDTPISFQFLKLGNSCLTFGSSPRGYLDPGPKSLARSRACQ